MKCSLVKSGENGIYPMENFKQLSKLHVWIEMTFRILMPYNIKVGKNM